MVQYIKVFIFYSIFQSFFLLTPTWGMKELCNEDQRSVLKKLPQELWRDHIFSELLKQNFSDIREKEVLKLLFINKEWKDFVHATLPQLNISLVLWDWP